jgi:hypothetical protein
MSLPILTVVGATGAQGSSVVSSALESGLYKVRAITRNTASDKAKALIAKGVEVVSADLNSESSLAAAFTGTTAIYAVTDFFEPFAAHGPEEAMRVEVQQGKNMANAAAATPTLKHYIWSTLPNGKEISGGKYLVPHFEAKNEIDRYIKSISGLYSKTTFLWVTWYGSNYVFPMFTPVHVPTSGKYLQIMPARHSTPILSIGDVRTNLGIFTNSILAQPSLTQRRYVVAHTETSTAKGLLETWGEVTQRQTAFVQTNDLEEYDNVWPRWGKEMGVMMQFWNEYKEKSWSGHELLTTKELGLEAVNFVGIEETYKAMDW